MTEFISHKVKITAIYGAGSNQANHFVQSNTAIDPECVVATLHVPVHFGINQAENNCFIAYQCLVVTLGIADCFFVGASVGKFP